MKFTRTHLLCALLLATSPLARAGQIEVAVILAAPPQVSAHTAAVAHLDNATPTPKPESTLYAPMPEPDSVAIMAAGLGLAGFVMRRRRHGKQRAG